LRELIRTITLLFILSATLNIKEEEGEKDDSRDELLERDKDRDNEVRSILEINKDEKARLV
jgi:hypothetical protein